MAATIDKFDCYELCVQSPRHVIGMLRGIHAREARVLREDFCGSAAVARRWCESGDNRGDDACAVCVDLDDEALARARERFSDENVLGRVRLVRADALASTDEEQPPPEDGPMIRRGGWHPDIIWVGNFSIGYIHERAGLVAYLRASRERLMRGNGGFGGGVFVCDLYGGAGAFRLGSLERTHLGRGNEVIKYHWRHEEADALTGMVTNSISFRVIVDGELAAEYPRAFVYRWRLWGLAELREAMLEAGFTSTEVYKEVDLPPGEKPRHVEAGELPEDWIVMVSGRAE
jgi:hypothetical protein